MRTKRLRISLLITLLFIIFGAVIFKLSPSPRSWSDVEKEKMLRVVTTYNSCDYSLSEGKPMGFGYELVKDFADSLGFSLDITIESDFSKRIKGLKQGDYDLLMNFIVKTTESDKDFFLTEPLSLSRLMLVQKVESSSEEYVSDITDLEGKTIYIEKNSPYKMVLDNLKDDTGIDFAIEELIDASPDMLCSMILRNEIRYAAIDEIYVNSIVEYQTELNADVALGFEQLACWAVADESVRKKLDEYIKNRKETSEYFILKKRHNIR